MPFNLDPTISGEFRNLGGFWREKKQLHLVARRTKMQLDASCIGLNWVASYCMHWDYCPVNSVVGYHRVLDAERGNTYLLNLTFIGTAAEPHDSDSSEVPGREAPRRALVIITTSEHESCFASLEPPRLRPVRRPSLSSPRLERLELTIYLCISQILIQYIYSKPSRSSHKHPTSLLEPWYPPRRSVKRSRRVSVFRREKLLVLSDPTNAPAEGEEVDGDVEALNWHNTSSELHPLVVVEFLPDELRPLCLRLQWVPFPVHHDLTIRRAADPSTVASWEYAEGAGELLEPEARTKVGECRVSGIEDEGLTHADVNVKQGFKQCMHQLGLSSDIGVNSWGASKNLRTSLKFKITRNPGTARAACRWVSIRHFELRDAIPPVDVPSVKTRTLREGNREVCEILSDSDSSDSEENGLWSERSSHDGGGDKRSGRILAPPPIRYAKRDIEPDRVRHGTVWLDEEISSRLRVGEFVVTKNLTVDPIEYVSGDLPFIYPISEARTAIVIR
ncbi:hypothetical protein FB451DRAFT_1185522 [Mycena latifolia]|nr:hypothetical protein FB451DRAFT_1185522 [Mycena latifolia]